MEFKLISPDEGKFFTKIEFNYEELKTQIQEAMKKYESVVYTPDNLKDAKADKAKLNKFKEALETERKKIKNDYMKPYLEFENKIKELTAFVDLPIAQISGQVTAYEEETKEAKKQAIAAFYADKAGGLTILLSFEKIFNPKWLNSTYAMTKIQNEIEEIIAKIHQDIDTIENLKICFEHKLQIKDTYLQTLDFSKAMNELRRLEELDSKFAALKPVRAIKEVENDTIYTRRIWVKGTEAQLKAFGRFLKENNIEYGGIDA